MLRTLSAGQLASQCQRAMGWTAGIPSGTYAGRLTDAINHALLRAWRAAQWPQLMRLERRTFRPPWQSDTYYAECNEVWFEGAYWRALKDQPLHSPGYTDGEWREVEADELVRFVALDQPWEANEIDPTGIDLNAFAYAADPSLGNAEALQPCRLLGDYPGGGATRISLPADAPNRVWIRFIPKCIQISLDEWKPDAVYVFGDTVRAGDECYRCISNSSTNEPVSGYPWERVRIPLFLGKALIEAVRAELISDDEGRQRANAYFEKEIEELHSAYFGQISAFDSADAGRE